MNAKAKASRGTANVCAQNETPSDAMIGAACRPLFALLLRMLREGRSGEEREEWISHRCSPLGARRTRELARSGAFPGARKDGKKWLIPRAELNAYLEREGAAPPATRLDTRQANDHATAENDDHDVRAVLHEHGLELAPQRPRKARSSRS